MSDNFQTNGSDEKYYRDGVARESGAIPRNTERAVVESGTVSGLAEYHNQDDLRRNAKVDPPSGSDGNWTFKKGAEVPLAFVMQEWDDIADQLALFDADGRRLDDARALTDGGQRANASEGEGDGPAISTWGDVDEKYRNLTPPDGVSADDPITESRLEDWLDEVFDQIDASDLKTLTDMPSGKEKMELAGKFAEQGTGKNDLDPGDWIEHDMAAPEGDPHQNGHGDPRTDGGRQNAEEPPWRGRYGVSDLMLDDDARENANIEDVPSGGDPFNEDADSNPQADLSPMQTDGTLRPNAGEDGPDVPTGGPPLSRTNATTHKITSPFEDSVEQRLEQVSGRANAVYEKLEADGPETGYNIAVNSSRLNRDDVGSAIIELQQARLTEAKGGSPQRYGPVTESREDPRSEI